MSSSSIIKKYSSNTFWMLFEKIFRLFVALIVNILVARTFGVDQYGLMSYAMSIVGLLYAIETLGLDDVIVKSLVEKKVSQDIVLGTSFILRYLGSFLLISIVLVFICISDNSNKEKLAILIFSFTSLIHPFFIINLFFQSIVKAKHTSLAQIYSIAITFIFRIIIIIFCTNIIWIVFSYTFEKMLTALLYIRVYKKFKYSLSSWKFKLNVSSCFLSRSWPLILSGIAILTYMRVDQLMIKEYLGLESLGVYSVAVKLSEAFYYFPAVITASFFPEIIKSNSIAKIKFENRLMHLFSFLYWLSIVISLFVCFMSNFIISTLFGEAYINASTPLKYHSVALLFVGIGIARQKWLIVENLQKYHLYFTLFAVIMNVVLNTLFIPIYGINGAAFSTLLCQFFSVMIFPLFFEKTKICSRFALKSLNPAYCYRLIKQL